VVSTATTTPTTTTAAATTSTAMVLGCYFLQCGHPLVKTHLLYQIILALLPLQTTSSTTTIYTAMIVV